MLTGNFHFGSQLLGQYTSRRVCVKSVRGPWWRGRNGAAILDEFDDALDAVGCRPLLADCRKYTSENRRRFDRLFDAAGTRGKN